MTLNAIRPLDQLPPVTAWLTDMDGVLVHEQHAIPGAQEFLDTLRDLGLPFLVLTNTRFSPPATSLPV